MHVPQPNPPVSARRGVMAITGAAGMLGSALCAHFARAGWTVRALVRDLARVPDAQPGVTYHLGELPDRLDTAALDGALVVIHAAYTTRFKTLADAKRTNEDGTRALTAAALRAGVPAFVFISTIAAQEHARSYYGQSKLALERELAITLGSQRLLNIRPGLVLARTGGLFSRMVVQVQHARFIPVFAGGRQPLQTIHVDDVVRGVDLAITGTHRGTLTLAEPEPITLVDLLRMMADRLHRRVRFVPVPGGPAVLALKAAERLGVHLSVSSENLLGLLSQRAVDTRTDLARLGLHVRPVRESLDDLFSPIPHYR